MFNLLIFTSFISFVVGAPLQYVFVNESMTWSDAQSYCREKFSDLATIEDLQQTVQLLDVAGDGLIDLAWIGLYDDLNVWKWTLQDTDLVQGGSDFTNWYDPTPVVDHTDGMCVYTQSGVWYADNCLTQHSFICYDGRPNATATYVQSVPTKSWSDAQSYCREFYTDLSSIRSETENMEIELFVSQIFYQMIWIGLYKNRSWSDQSNSTFRNWGSGEPRYVGTCTAVNFLDGSWAEESCGDDLSFFCYSGPASSRQYYFVNQQVNWTEAQSFCREFYTDLATIDNPVELNQLISMIPGLIGGYCCLAWIGLYDDLNSWRWSLQDESFYKEGEKDFRNFYHEPNNEGGNQLCDYMNGDGYWFDENCDTIMEFICYDGRPNASQTYIRITQNYKNWTDARQYCRELYSDLVNVRNLTEHQQIYNNLRGPPAWIGLYRYRLWSDGQMNNFQNWRPEIPQSFPQPDNGYYAKQWGLQHCTAVSFRYSGRWTDEYCFASMPFFCYNRKENASTSYVLIMESKTWSDAQSYCREFYTDLVSIRNDTENTWVIHLIQTASTDAWIGLYRTRSWSDQSNSTFSNWKPGQPDNAQNSEYCTSVSFSDNGQWTDENCIDNLAFVCYMGSASSRQYYFVNQAMSWTEAQNYCRQNYTDLATIDNMEEMNQLISTVSGNFNSLAWIGLYDDVNSWRWSLQDERFYKEGEKDFRGFNHEPDSFWPNEFCVYLDWFGKWWSEPCSNLYFFMCYDGRPNPSQKYVLVQIGKNWSDAQSYCREMFTDLASVRNETELQEILAATLHAAVWIGLYRNRVWSDHSNSTFTNWLLGSSGDQAQPDNGIYFQGQAGSQHCTTVSLQSFGQWTDEACFLTHPFFCYIGEQDAYVMGLKVEFSSLVMLSESQVQEKVVNQLQLELVRRGVRGNFTSNLRSFRRIDP